MTLFISSQLTEEIYITEHVEISHAAYQTDKVEGRLTWWESVGVTPWTL